MPTTALARVPETQSLDLHAFFPASGVGEWQEHEKRLAALEATLLQKAAQAEAAMQKKRALVRTPNSFARITG